MLPLELTLQGCAAVLLDSHSGRDVQLLLIRHFNLLSSTTALLTCNKPAPFFCEHSELIKAMAKPMSPYDDWRIRHEAWNEFFNSTNTTYLTLRERMYNQDLSAVDCAKLYGDETIALTACPDTEDELWSFVSLLSRCVIELATQIHYSEDDVRTKFVKFINELRKVVVTDPRSPTGEQLIYPNSHEEKIWTDMPLLSLHLAEEYVSFGKSRGPELLVEGVTCTDSAQTRKNLQTPRAR